MPCLTNKQGDRRAWGWFQETVGARAPSGNGLSGELSQWAAAGVPAHPLPSITLRSGEVRSARSVFSPPLHHRKTFNAAASFLLRCQYAQDGYTAVKQKRHETRTCTTSSTFFAFATCFRRDESVTHGHRRDHRATGRDAYRTLNRVGQARSELAFGGLFSGQLGLLAV